VLGHEFAEKDLGVWCAIAEIGAAWFWHELVFAGHEMKANWLVVAAIAISAVGCTGTGITTDAGNSTSPADDALPSKGVESDDQGEPESGIRLDIVSWKEVQQWVAEQRGRVVVLDVWSTYCPKCMKEFPHFVALHEEKRDKVSCGSLSVDFYGGEGNSPEAVRPQVRKFLADQNATMTNFISGDPDSKVLKGISTVAIPAVVVYDREGQLHRIFNNDDGAFGPDGFTYKDDILPVIDQLLGEIEAEL
jgi:thiol-disulfide isomerase/thioredoxin